MKNKSKELHQEKKKRNEKETKFIKKCPNGGYCVNPICMFGCVEY